MSPRTRACGTRRDARVTEKSGVRLSRSLWYTFTESLFSCNISPHSLTLRQLGALGSLARPSDPETASHAALTEARHGPSPPPTHAQPPRATARPLGARRARSRAAAAPSATEVRPRRLPRTVRGRRSCAQMIGHGRRVCTAPTPHACTLDTIGDGLLDTGG